MSIIAGVGPSSGINYDDLITNLLKLERQPIDRLQSRQTTYNNKISAYNTLSTKLSALKSAADHLRTTSNFYARSASVSDTTVLDATASSSAAAGNYTIAAHSVAGKIALASEEKEVHSGVAASTTVVNNSGSDKVFQYTYATTQRTLTVVNGTTLEGLRDLINSDTSNPGVTATILNDGSSYRLVLTGNDAGSTKTITVDSGTTLDGTNSTTDFRSSTFTQTKTASDAKLRVDGVDISSSSNTITNVISGVTITLKKESTSSVTLSITNDTATISKNVQSLVSAYNDVVSYISSNSTYDTKIHIGGSLYAESTARGIIGRLQNIIISSVSGLTLDTLSQIGISTNRDGTLSVNTSTLNAKLSSDLTNIASLFTDTNGIGNMIYNYTDDATKSITGTIAVKVGGLKKTVNDISSNITNLEQKLTISERNLRNKFASLESLLGSMSTQGQFLSNVTSKW